MQVSPCQRELLSKNNCVSIRFPNKYLFTTDLIYRSLYKFRPQKEQLIVVSTDLLYSEKASTFLFKQKTWSVMQEASCFLKALARSAAL
uniref:Uncharacterized protein n=1 Tax=Populus trichocarpa TaxID=3694 RepID=A0A2K2CB31_POPTR